MAMKRHKFYTRKQVAKILNFSLRTIDTMIKNDQLNAVKIGKSVRIPISEIRKFEIDEVL
jgi:excisionase family DNA binding protein